MVVGLLRLWANLPTSYWRLYLFGQGKVYAVNECLLNGTSGHLRLFSGAMWDRFTVRDASDRVRVGSDCGLGSIGLQKKVPAAMSML